MSLTEEQLKELKEIQCVLGKMSSELLEMQRGFTEAMVRLHCVLDEVKSS